MRPRRVIGRFALMSMEDGVRWKTNSSPADAATWEQLDGRGPGPDNAGALARQALQTALGMPPV